MLFGTALKCTLLSLQTYHCYIGSENSILTYQLIMLQEAHLYPVDGLCRYYIPCMRIKYFEPYINIKLDRNNKLYTHLTVNIKFV